MGGGRQETRDSRCETGDGRQEMGERRLEKGDRKRGTWERRWETGDRRRETGDGRKETGDRIQKTVEGKRETEDGRQEKGDGRGLYDVQLLQCCGAGDGVNRVDTRVSFVKKSREFHAKRVSYFAKRNETAMFKGKKPVSFKFKCRLFIINAV